MRKRHLASIPLSASFLSLGLLAILLVACAPAESSATTSPIASATPIILQVTATPVVDFTATRAYEDSLNSATPPPTAQAVATSRGPKLEAIDPTTVSLASGGIQFVEFFRFT